MAAFTFKDSSDNTYIDRTTNDWGIYSRLFSTSTYVNQNWHLYTLTEDYYSQIWALYEEQYINQIWSLSLPTTNYISQLWGTEIVNYIHQNYGDAPVITQIINQYWWDAGVTTKYINQMYGDMAPVVKVIDQIYNLIGEVQNHIDQDYSITDSITQQYVSELWNLEAIDFAEQAIHQMWSLVETPTETNNITYGVTINGEQAFSPDISLEADEDSAAIEASLTIVNPNYFHLCVRNNPVTLTIVDIDFELIIREVSVNMGNPSDTYSISCESPVSLLSSKQAPTLQKEFDEDLASVIFAELADIMDLTTSWNVWHDGALVDWVIPAGELFANNEKPLAVMRKITEACGGAIQSFPDGTIEAIHEFPTRVPDWPTGTPDYIVNNLVRFESVSASDEEKSGINTIYVSDQLTSDTSYTLSEEDISSTKKQVKGYHTPWDTTEIELDTSGGSDVVITYIGVEDTTQVPPEDEEAELVEFIDGTGSTSQPIYSIVDSEWVRDSLGAITFSEDGTLESEVKDESLLKIRYITKYHVWEVTSPTLPDIQCSLRLVE